VDTLGFTVDDVVAELTVTKAFDEVVAFRGVVESYEADDAYPSGVISPELESVTQVTIRISSFESIIGVTERVYMRTRVSANSPVNPNHEAIRIVTIHKSQAALNIFMNSGEYRYVMTRVSSSGLESAPFIPTTDAKKNEEFGVKVRLSTNTEGQYILRRTWDPKAMLRLQQALRRAQALDVAYGTPVDENEVSGLEQAIAKAQEEQETLPESEIIGNELSGDPFWPVITLPNMSDTKLRLYRTLAGGGPFFLLKEFDPVEEGSFWGEFVDFTTDWELLGSPLLKTEDLLPPVYKYSDSSETPELKHSAIATVHLGRVWVAVDDRVYFSEPAVAGQCHTANWFQFDGPVTAVVSLTDKLLVFTQTTLSVVGGSNPSNFVKFNVAGLYGALNHKVVAKVAGRIVWTGLLGVFSFDDDSITNHTEFSVSEDFDFGAIRAGTVDGSSYLAFHSGGVLRVDFARGAAVSREELPFGGLGREILSAHTKRSTGEAFFLAPPMIYGMRGPVKALLRYKTAITEDNLAGVTKIYNKVFAHVVGSLSIEVFIDDRSVYLWDIEDSSGPLSVYLPTSVDLRGEGISYRVVGSGTLHYVRHEFEALEFS